MKKIIIPLLCLMLTCCGNNNKLKQHLTNVGWYVDIDYGYLICYQGYYDLNSSTYIKTWESAYSEYDIVYVKTSGSQYNNLYVYTSGYARLVELLKTTY